MVLRNHDGKTEIVGLGTADMKNSFGSIHDTLFHIVVLITILKRRRSICVIDLFVIRNGLSLTFVRNP